MKPDITVTLENRIKNIAWKMYRPLLEVESWFLVFHNNCVYISILWQMFSKSMDSNIFVDNLQQTSLQQTVESYANTS